MGNISPKVIVSFVVGIVLTSLLTNIGAITPEMLDFLGPWKYFVLGTLVTIAQAVAAWWKTDPLRNQEPAPAEAPVPAPAAPVAPPMSPSGTTQTPVVQ